MFAIFDNSIPLIAKILQSSLQRDRRKITPQFLLIELQKINEKKKKKSKEKTFKWLRSS